MFKIYAFLARKSGLSAEQYKDYYENKHVPLILSLTDVPLVYKRNYLQHGDPSNIESDKIGFDSVTEMVFASREDQQRWLAKLAQPGVGARVRADEERFIDHSHYFAYVAEERVTSAYYPTAQPVVTQGGLAAT